MVRVTLTSDWIWQNCDLYIFSAWSRVGNLSSGLDRPTPHLSNCATVAESNHFSRRMIHAMINENSLGQKNGSEKPEPRLPISFLHESTTREEEKKW